VTSGCQDCGNSSLGSAGELEGETRNLQIAPISSHLSACLLFCLLNQLQHTTCYPCINVNCAVNPSSLPLSTFCSCLQTPTSSTMVAADLEKTPSHSSTSMPAHAEKCHIPRQEDSSGYTPEETRYRPQAHLPPRPLVCHRYLRPL
jgi:hypothetical protein